MTPSKKAREEATMICALAASNPDLCEDYYLVAMNYDVTWDGLNLAYQAWAEACQRLDGIEFAACKNNGVPEVDAEAVALLETGWEP